MLKVEGTWVRVVGFGLGLQADNVMIVGLGFRGQISSSPVADRSDPRPRLAVRGSGGLTVTFFDAKCEVPQNIRKKMAYHKIVLVTSRLQQHPKIERIE